MAEVDTWYAVLLAVELLNFLVMFAVFRWTRKAGKKLIASVLKTLNLTQGTEPSALGRLRGFIGGLSEKAGAAVERGEAIDLGGIAEALGVDEDRLKGLAQTYLGARGMDAGRRAPISQDPLAAILTKVLGGGISQADWPMAVPLIVDFLRGNGQEVAVPDDGARW